MSKATIVLTRYTLTRTTLTTHGLSQVERWAVILKWAATQMRELGGLEWPKITQITNYSLEQIGRTAPLAYLPTYCCSYFTLFSDQMPWKIKRKRNE